MITIMMILRLRLSVEYYVVDVEVAVVLPLSFVFQSLSVVADVQLLTAPRIAASVAM